MALSSRCPGQPAETDQCRSKSNQLLSNAEWRSSKFAMSIDSLRPTTTDPWRRVWSSMAHFRSLRSAPEAMRHDIHMVGALGGARHMAKAPQPMPPVPGVCPAPLAPAGGVWRCLTAYVPPSAGENESFAVAQARLVEAMRTPRVPTTAGGTLTRSWKGSVGCDLPAPRLGLASGGHPHVVGGDGAPAASTVCSATRRRSGSAYSLGFGGPVTAVQRPRAPRRGRRCRLFGSWRASSRAWGHFRGRRHRPLLGDSRAGGRTASRASATLQRSVVLERIAPGSK